MGQNRAEYVQEFMLSYNGQSVLTKVNNLLQNLRRYSGVKIHQLPSKITSLDVEYLLLSDLIDSNTTFSQLREKNGERFDSLLELFCNITEFDIKI